MGLTLHYKLRGPLGLTEEAARALVASMRTAALTMKQAGRVEAVGAIGSSRAEFAWLSEWIILENAVETTDCTDEYGLSIKYNFLGFHPLGEWFMSGVTS